MKQVKCMKRERETERKKKEKINNNKPKMQKFITKFFPMQPQAKI